MRLALQVPTEWPVRPLGDQRVAVIAAGATDWRTVLAWGALVPFPDDPNAWVQRAMHVDIGPDATVKPGPSATKATRSGWPLRILDVQVLVGGAVVEWRLGVFYTFLEYGAVALVRSRDEAALEAARPRLLEVFESGAPDWSADGQVVCLHDLFAPPR